ncbi:MAG: hypothetical protein HOP11_11195 [Saprospiraceae bacterium]|nr:hypothetical protein [Saprospiraceae bacterium]
MKKLILTSLIALSLPFLKAQSDSTGLAGDQVNLHGILELFQKSSSPEEFEKNINDESNKVNNLDLNNDGEVDYIKVIGSQKEDAHIFILQVPVSESENQDIAVLELEKTGKQEAQIQIIGDEEIFGADYILEPKSEADNEEADDEGGPNVLLERNTAIVVNVWGWPCVRFVYAPGYVVYSSPWRWRVYPTWWRPWRNIGWAVWHPIRFRYSAFPIRHHSVVRCVNAHKVYRPIRSHSTTVTKRYAPAHKNHTVTRKKTTVTGPKGHTRTKTTTTVKGKKGNVKAKRTTVRRK